MIAWAPRFGRSSPSKPKRMKIQFIDERLDHADWIVLRHVIIQALGKQKLLTAIPALNVACHGNDLVASWPGRI